MPLFLFNLAAAIALAAMVALDAFLFGSPIPTALVQLAVVALVVLSIAVAHRPVVLVLGLIFASFITPAFAQTLATSSAPPADQLFHVPAAAWSEINALIIGIVVSLLTIGFKWLDNRSPLKNTQAEQIARDAFTVLLCNGAKYGLTQLQSAERKVGDIDVGNAAVAAGANYVIAQGPALAAKMGFDVTTADGRAAIIRGVTLRVADLMTAPHEAPAALPLPESVQPVAAPASK